MKNERVVVVGAGVGGLAVAIRAAAAGRQVTVVEQADGPGGKLRERWVGGYRFDLGPSLFTLPELVMELDALARAASPRAAGLPEFRYRKLDRAAEYFWEDGTRFTAWSDAERRAEEVRRAFGIDAGAVQRHLELSRRVFEWTRPVFLERSLHEWATYRDGAVWGLVRRLGALPLLGSLHRRNARRLKHPHLVQLFDRYATYNGSDPFRAPAMLLAIPHLEHGLGTYLPEGGMGAISRHLHALGEALGVDFQFSTPVERILHAGGRVEGVGCADGRIFRAETVVSNADIHPTYRSLLPDLPAPERILQAERSTSGLILYLGVRGVFPELHVHNLFFSSDYRSEFQRIRTDGDPGDDPTVYLNITSVAEPADAPPGCSNFFVMVNVQAGALETEADVARVRGAAVDRLSRALGTDVASRIEAEEVLTPHLIQTRTSSWKGALYGASSNSAMAAFLRHRNRSTGLHGLYVVGGSVHPGGGIPLCLMGAKIVSDLLDVHA